MTIAEQLAQWSVAVSWERVPEAVRQAAKRCVIDLVGVALAAREQPLVRHVLAHAQRTSAQGPCSVFGSEAELAAPGAALVNATAGHALDFDDTSYTGIMHGTTVVLPAALAVTQAARGNGRRVLEAFVAGVEVAYAVALLCTTRHYHRGWWSTASLGALGAAAAAARAYGLTGERATSALALAGLHASGLKAGFGTDGKPWLAGRAAALGVEAALLAADGVVGPARVFEGQTGFLAMLNDGYSNAASLDALGQRWRLVDPGIFFKQYPVCSGAHAAVEMVEHLLSEHQLTAEDVASVTCEVPPVVAISLVYDRPNGWQEAQFSLPFAVGTMLARGRLDVACLSDATLADPQVRANMAKVTMQRVDALHSDEAPEGARVTLTTRDGRRFAGELAQPTGMPKRPLSDARLHAKFAQCAQAGGLDAARAGALLAQLTQIENAPSALLSA